MRNGCTGRLGVVVAAVGIGVLGTGCFPRLPVPPTQSVSTTQLRVRPSPAKFPSTPPPYWPMPIVKVTVTNTGNTTIKAVVVHPVGVYSVPSSTCKTLGPGQHCVASVQFCPTKPNRYVDTLVVTGKNAVTGKQVRATATLEEIAT